jgi:hypothetical protein
VGTTERATSIITPWKAFALVLTLATIATTTIYLTTRPTASPSSAPEKNRLPIDHLVTPEKGLSEVRGVLDDAYASADVQLAMTVLVPNSPALRRVSKGIRRLEVRGLSFQRDITSLDVEVVQETSGSATLREELISDGKIVDADGNEVGATRRPERQVVVWELRWVDQGWLLFDSTITAAEPI